MRPLRESDIDAARELLRHSLPALSQLAPLLSVLELAVLAPDDEQRALVAEVDGSVAAIAVYGEFAGAAGAGRLHLVAVDQHHRRRGIGTLLVERVLGELGARPTRFILAELPEERPALDGYFAFLRASGFTEESRVPDFYRDGVAMVMMRREAGPGI